MEKVIETRADQETSNIMGFLISNYGELFINKIMNGVISQVAKNLKTEHENGELKEKYEAWIQASMSRTVN